jgi:hypothetical protein
MEATGRMPTIVRETLRWARQASPLLVVVVIACGGSSGAKVSDRNKAMAAYQDCMAQHGVQRPGSGNTTVDQDTLERANAACKSLQPKLGNPSPPSQAQQQDALRWAACMRQHGVDVPDPNTNAGSGGGNQSADKIDPRSPQFRAAGKACNHLISGNGNQGGQGGQLNGGSGS